MTTETSTPELATSNPCERELTIEVPADVVKNETDSIVNRYSKLARVAGFRKGKVPPALVRQRFAKEIKEDVIEALVPRYLREETEKQHLAPVSQPRVRDLQMEQGEPLRFKASFEILPEFKLASYDDIKITTLDTNVSDEEVETALKNLRERQATFTAVEEERPLTDGDFAVVGFKGTPKEGKANAQPVEAGEADGIETTVAGSSQSLRESQARLAASEQNRLQDSDSATATSQDTTREGETAAKPVEVEEVMVDIGGENTVPEFTRNLRGAKAGESRTFDVKYADDFSDKRLAGKTLTYEVNVKGIKTRSVPELNDDFAKELSTDFATLDDLRNRLRENMKAEKEHEAQHQGKDKLVEELVKRNDFPVPEAMVNEQIDTRLERGLRALAAQGMRTEDMKRMDFQRLRAGQHEAALREVRASLILEKVADEEKIEVTDEEFERELQAFAEQSKLGVDEVRKRLTENGGLERMRHRLRNEKTLDTLYRRAV